jgi:hypothetical protein
MPIEKEKLDDLKKTHGRVVHLSDTDEEDNSLLWEAVFRVPTKREFDTYTAKNDQGQGTKGLEQLARTIVIFPSREEFDALLEKFPGLHISLGNSERFKTLVGMGGDQHRK